MVLFLFFVRILLEFGGNCTFVPVCAIGWKCADSRYDDCFYCVSVLHHFYYFFVYFFGNKWGNDMRHAIMDVNGNDIDHDRGK